MKTGLFLVAFGLAFWFQAAAETEYERAVRTFWAEHPNACPCDGCCEQRFGDGAWRDFTINTTH